jgi:dTDP-4-dehydrorhamnose reductase
MSTILLTGCRGMLGRRLHEELARGHRVVATTWPPEPGFRELDLTDRSAVGEAVRGARPGWIVNAAAYTAVDRAESEPELAFAVNEDGPGHLADAAVGIGARLLHVSTDFVFDGAKPEAYVEDDPTGPLGVYARSKEAGERRVRESGVEHLILRVAWLFGPEGGNFVDTIRRLAAERDRLQVVDDQRGTPTFTADAASLVHRLIHQDLRGTIHGANRGETTWYGLAREVIARCGIATDLVPCTTAEYPTPAPRPRNSALCNRVLEDTMGHFTRPWTEALDAHLQWEAP